MLSLLNEFSEFKPDSRSATPMYQQLSNRLAHAIHDGSWLPDEALPSERRLSDQLNISRVTARRAIDILCERGMLTRRHGSGTFITPRLEQPLSRLTNFSEELRQRGFAPGSQWLSRQTGVAAPEEMLALDLLPNAQVSRLKRLRLADDVVMAIEMTTVPVHYLPNPQLVTDSLYGYLSMRGAAPVRALQHIRAANADAEQADLMGLKHGAALLYITRVGYHANGVAMELTHSYCRNDYYDFVAELFK
jgi:GntR family transcriptional regulator